MRKKLWELATKNHPEGTLLPRHLLFVRAILYPLDYIYFKIGQSRGYQWDTDTWRIEGLSYTGSAMRALANANGETYRINRTGDIVTLEKVEWQPIETAPKDGTAVLAWFPELEQMVATYDKNDTANSAGGWSVGFDYYGPKPTHWTPLPATINISNKGHQ